MADPFIGEIKMWALNFAPYGWAFCNGQLLPIAQNTALFSILGTTYGGNGTTNFGLPNLQGRAPMHYGAGPGLTPRSLGQSNGEPTVTLITTEMPIHNHNLTAQNVNAESLTASNQYLGNSMQTTPRGTSPYNTFNTATGLTPMSSSAVQNVGGGQPHENMQPYLAINFCIA
ncbi:MAG TPA: tail fiber protein, partial [Candidatus Deferrimicrobium sp.]|nr:tail fiber protein [Candidatus Deferrimicrobium sp.]